MVALKKGALSRATLPAVVGSLSLGWNSMFFCQAALVQSK
jgi:hypothetical protein